MGANIYKNKKPLFLFLIPAFLLMTVYLYYPFMMNIYNSFQSIAGMGDPSRGWNSPWYANYVEIFTDPNMHTAMKNTGIMMIATLVFQVGAALVLALLVDNIKRGQKFFRIVYFFRSLSLQRHSVFCLI